MSKKGKNHGWCEMARWHKYDNVPITETEFELLLRRLALTEDQAQHSQKVKDWVFRWHRSRYVPSKVLDAFQIDDQWI